MQVPIITLGEDDSCLTSLNSACQRICTASAVSGELGLTHHIIHVEKFAVHENVRWGRVGRWEGIYCWPTSLFYHNMQVLVISLNVVHV